MKDCQNLPQKNDSQKDKPDSSHRITAWGSLPHTELCHPHRGNIPLHCRPIWREEKGLPYCCTVLDVAARHECSCQIKMSTDHFLRLHSDKYGSKSPRPTGITIDTDQVSLTNDPSRAQHLMVATPLLQDGNINGAQPGPCGNPPADLSLPSLGSGPRSGTHVRASATR